MRDVREILAKHSRQRRRAMLLSLLLAASPVAAEGPSTRMLPAPPPSTVADQVSGAVPIPVTNDSGLVLLTRCGEGEACALTPVPITASTDNKDVDGSATTTRQASTIVLKPAVFGHVVPALSQQQAGDPIKTELTNAEMKTLAADANGADELVVADVAAPVVSAAVDSGAGPVLSAPIGVPVLSAPISVPVLSAPIGGPVTRPEMSELTPVAQMPKEVVTEPQGVEIASNVAEMFEPNQETAISGPAPLLFSLSDDSSLDEGVAEPEDFLTESEYQAPEEVVIVPVDQDPIDQDPIDQDPEPSTLAQSEPIEWSLTDTDDLDSLLISDDPMPRELYQNNSDPMNPIVVGPVLDAPILEVAPLISDDSASDERIVADSRKATDTLALESKSVHAIEPLQVPGNAQRISDLGSQSSLPEQPTELARAKRYRPPVAVTSVPLAYERLGDQETPIAAPTVEPVEEPLLAAIPSGQEASRVKLTPLYLSRAQIRSLTIGGEVRAIKVADQNVCQAFATGSNQLKLVGTGSGVTQLVIWANPDGGDSATRMRAFEIHVHDSGAEAAGKTSQPSKHSVVGELQLLGQTIRRDFPRCQVSVQSDGQRLVVSGRCDSDESATQILRLVRKTFLVPVRDDLSIR